MKSEAIDVLMDIMEETLDGIARMVSKDTWFVEGSEVGRISAGVVRKRSKSKSVISKPRLFIRGIKDETKDHPLMKAMMTAVRAYLVAQRHHDRPDTWYDVPVFQ